MKQCEDTWNGNGNQSHSFNFKLPYWLGSLRTESFLKNFTSSLWGNNSWSVCWCRKFMANVYISKLKPYAWVPLSLEIDLCGPAWICDPVCGLKFLAIQKVYPYSSSLLLCRLYHLGSLPRNSTLWLYDQQVERNFFIFLVVQFKGTEHAENCNSFLTWIAFFLIKKPLMGWN